MTSIRIEPQPWDVICRQAKASYPEECCGVLLGYSDQRGRTVLLAYPLANAAPADRRTHDELTSSDLMTAQTRAAGLGMSLVGIYHSHPDRGAGCSTLDLNAAYPWLSYVIVSVRNGEIEESASWAVNFGQTEARPEHLEIAGTTNLRLGRTPVRGPE